MVGPLTSRVVNRPTSKRATGGPNLFHGPLTGVTKFGIHIAQLYCRPTKETTGLYWTMKGWAVKRPKLRSDCKWPNSFMAR